MPVAGPILVTGGTGFIGANLVRHLQIIGGEVHVVIRDGKKSWRLENNIHNLVVHHVDIRDKKGIHDVVKKIQPEQVYHLATFGAYPYQSDIYNIAEANILGSLNLFYALEKSTTLKCFVNVGTSSEYGPKQEPMHEFDLLEPVIPYGVAKAAQTLFAQYFARARQLPIVTLRLFAVYGPYEAPGRLISDIMCALVKNKPLKLSSPMPTRDFVFMDDTIDALLLASQAPSSYGEIFNIGGGVEYSVGDVVERAMKIVGKSVPIEWGNEEKQRAYDTTRWVADISKTKSQLGWVPAHTLDEGLHKTFEWYQQHINLYDNEIVR